MIFIFVIQIFQSLSFIYADHQKNWQKVYSNAMLQNIVIQILGDLQSG